MIGIVQLAYDHERDQAYVELVSEWKDTEGWSNMALMRSDGDTIELHFFFSEASRLQAIMIAGASEWVDPVLLESADRFVPFDESNR